MTKQEIGEKLGNQRPRLKEIISRVQAVGTAVTARQIQNGEHVTQTRGWLNELTKKGLLRSEKTKKATLYHVVDGLPRIPLSKKPSRRKTPSKAAWVLVVNGKPRLHIRGDVELIQVQVVE